jgi:hypothetical protein
MTNFKEEENKSRRTYSREFQNKKKKKLIRDDNIPQ